MRKNRTSFNRRRGMAMATVLFAMTVVMLLGALITTSALVTRSSVLGAESNFKQRNRLLQIGEYFVCEVKQCRVEGNVFDAEQAATDIVSDMQTAFTDYEYKYFADIAASDADSNVTNFTLTVYTADGDGSDNDQTRTDLMTVTVQETFADGAYTYKLVEWKY